ncbi:MAG TPA: beta-propeller domain-containing protein [Myxococcaceae bacterium]|nr:beta-propeller domain-containing protein [Myxococcaceae bacterium]
MSRAGLIAPFIVFSLIGCRPSQSTQPLLPPLPEMPGIQDHVSLTTISPGKNACAEAEQLIEDQTVLWMRIALENARHDKLVLTTPGYQDAGTSGGPPTTSTTNLQTAGVDEPDVMKNDGTRMFTISSNSLVTLQTWPDTQLQIKGSVPIGWGARELLLTAPDRVLVFSALSGGTHVTSVDVSDMANPRVLGAVEIPGNYLTARRVGAAVRVILRDFFTLPPDVNLSPDLPAEDRAAWDRQAIANEGLIRDQPLSHWLPPVTALDASGQAVQSWPHPCDQLSSSNAPVQRGLTAVVTLDATDLAPVGRWSMLGNADTVYASPTALYLAAKHYWWWLQDWAGLRTATYVHEFDLSTAATAVHVGSGVFEGDIPNSFALDEWNGRLRVATSVFQPGGGLFARTNRVLVLQPSGRELVEVGRSPDFAGGELLESARFLGDRAFVVTFRRVDPLFTLDMSDPTAPRIAGELTVPGFSTYLHPVSDTQLVGVGAGSENGAQVGLFDVSDLAHPTQTSTIQITNGTSEAQRDHHAFTWLPEQKLFAIPVDSWDLSGRYTVQGGLRVFQVSGADLLPRGTLSIPAPPGGTSSIRRSILTTEDAYALASDRVVVSRLTDPSTPVATAYLPWP